MLNFLNRYLRPDHYVQSVIEIDLTFLKQSGYNTLLFDLDNTLLGWKAQKISDEVMDWVNRAKQLGFKMLILSNSLPKRVHRLSKTIELPAIAIAAKPRKRGFTEALKLVGGIQEQTVVIGDQLFTDVLGAKRNNLYTILVVPVDRYELFVTRLIRIPERFILQRLLKLDPAEESKT